MLPAGSRLDIENLTTTLVKPPNMILCFENLGRIRRYDGSDQDVSDWQQANHTAGFGFDDHSG